MSWSENFRVETPQSNLHIFLGKKLWQERSYNSLTGKTVYLINGHTDWTLLAERYKIWSLHPHSHLSSAQIFVSGSCFQIPLCIVLMGWSLLSNALQPFQIYCAPTNLDITRTWIFRLNFAQGPIFSGLKFFNEPETSDSGPSRRTCAQEFYLLKKSIDLSRVWTREPWISRRAHYPETTEADFKYP